MTIDERLERLAERHEALTQSVEMIAKSLTQLEKRHEAMTTFVNDIAEGTARLLHIAQIHEHRRTRLEGSGSE